jgi:hypothetical protein
MHGINNVKIAFVIINELGFHRCGMKCNVWEVKGKVHPCTSRAAHRGSFMTNGTRRGRGVSVTPRPLFTPGKDPVPFVQEAGWAPGPV